MNSHSRKRGLPGNEYDVQRDLLQRMKRADQREQLEQDEEGLELSAKTRGEATEEDEYPENEDEQLQQLPSYSGGSRPTEDLGARLLKAHGFTGTGLGKHGQGRREPIELPMQKGRLGLGHSMARAVDAEELAFDVSDEVTEIEEHPDWLECEESKREEIAGKLSTQAAKDWITRVEPKKMSIEDEDRYCSRETIAEMLSCKNVFDDFDSRTLNNARLRANPYETLKGAIFQNRAAMKAANLDRIFEWRLSREFDAQRRLAKHSMAEDQVATNEDRESPLFYFADVCAGPGGFSEYMLWRKGFYNAKGFGFTLCNNDDFKLEKFKAASSEYFQTYYGEVGDGDVYNPRNLSSLEAFVKAKTAGRGVHLVMCDGGFSVEGKENIQEILSKRLYLCQFIVGLALAQPEEGDNRGGNFFCKLFDIFTPFSVGLIYLMYCAFRRVSLHKPLTSRPANSERYIFCESLTPFGATLVKDYLIEVNNQLETMSFTEKQDIYEIIPESLIAEDKKFFNYVVKHNEEVAKRQIFYLKKYRLFAQEAGKHDSDMQGELRDKCLDYYEIPMPPAESSVRKRPQQNRFQPSALAFAEIVPKDEMNRPIITLQGDWHSGKKSPLFTLNTLTQKSPKHLASHEFYATLLPECSEPALLVSNSGGAVTLFSKEGHPERWDTLRMPPDTLLLVQLTEKHVELQEPSSGEKRALPSLVPLRGSARRVVIYIVDAARLNGDDIFFLNISKRLSAVQKFCDAINKHEPEWRRSDSKSSLKVVDKASEDQNEFVCAQALSLCQLMSKKVNLHQYRGAEVATLEVHGASGKSFLLKCQAVRFSKLLKGDWTVQWSQSQRSVYYYNSQAGSSIFPKDVEPSSYSTFYESIKADTSCIWPWAGIGPRGDRWGVASILNTDGTGPSFGCVTIQALSEALAREAEASGYSEGATFQ